MSKNGLFSLFHYFYSWTAMLERNHLRVIQAVDHHGSVTAAAKQLHLTQSALSHTMRKLELSAGTAIWLREGRRLRLTQAGEFLLDVANRLLPQLEHAEAKLRQFAEGERGTLRIGMECHPCYQWLLKIVSPFLAAWPDVDVDVKQKFQFGGLGALQDFEIDLLVTPDPFYRPGLVFEPVFDYEQVLVVPADHVLATREHVIAQDLRTETLLTYPVALDRLDVYTRFLNPAAVAPRNHKSIETTDIMLQMVAGGRGVAALPRWLAEEYCQKLPLVALRMGPQGVDKQIFLGSRESDGDTEYLQAFIRLARSFDLTDANGPV